ncbi:hypothetical protein EON80_32405 [bacterium]|nr:MAG: hypothetical protein EON80_32405 [bacterium]
MVFERSGDGFFGYRGALRFARVRVELLLQRRTRRPCFGIAREDFIAQTRRASSLLPALLRRKEGRAFWCKSERLRVT